MPELPEVETVRRMLERHVVGRTVRSVALSGLKLRGAVARDLPRRLAGRTFRNARRLGKYLLLDLDAGLTLLSHLGMSGRWLFHPGPPPAPPIHVHARLAFRDGSALWFQDARRFGVLELVATEALARHPSLAILGPDPVFDPPDGARLHALSRGARVAVKNFLLDQRRIAGIGNIYASEILFRARVDPRRSAGAVPRAGWDAIARAIPVVLGEAVERMGTTFSMYRTLWNEPGTYGERLMVYDRAGQPCRSCGMPIRRVVQGQRSTFFCPDCQGRPSRTGGVRVTMMARSSRPGPVSRKRTLRPSEGTPSGARSVARKPGRR
jgi:formamidopyrimidine-DNA glycosylase